MKSKLHLSKYICLFLAFISCMMGCSKHSTPNPVKPNADSTAATLTSPVAVNVYPALVTTNNGNQVGRVFIKTMTIGNLQITLPLLFDTGSAGVTINALSVFPSSIVDANGFKFASGHDTIQYQGITITDVNVQKIYGTAGSITTKEIGNIGYATLAVGDGAGSIHMLKMPILFFYQTLANGVVSANGLGSVFGVNSAYNTTQYTSDTTQTLNLVSPLKYLLYHNNLIAGFRLNMLTLSGCQINTAGSCTPQALFTVGLTQTDESGYAMNSLTASSPQPVLTSQPGYPAYPAFTTFNAAIPGCTISNGVQSWNTALLPDSGNPGVILTVAEDEIDPADHPEITITTPSKNIYSYNVNTAPFTTTYNPAFFRSNSGIYFFTRFNFLEDFQNGLIGLK